MSCLRPLLIAIVCCLTLAVPAQARGMLDGFGPKCPALQERLADTSAATQAPRDSGAGIVACVGFQAIAPRGVEDAFAVSIAVHDPLAHDRLVIAKRPSGIERPPRG